jgi:hypothetical protein
MDAPTAATVTARQPPPESDARSRPRGVALAEAATLLALTGLVALAYVWTRAPLYNPPFTIDPWLYTALWTNFGQIYHAFAGTYYVSRIPWIVPGYLMNGIFDARTASLILHALFFFGGGVLFYVLCRRYLGPIAGAVGYVALIGNQLYFTAHRWDYQEGAVLTFMIATFAFALPRTTRTVPRALALGASGFFGAATVTTRILDVAYLIGLPILYFAVVRGDWTARLSRFGKDAAAWIVGATTLVVACGIFSRTHGTEFLYFMPQVRIVRSGSGEGNQIPVDQWLPYAPYFALPIFVVVLAAVVLLLDRRGDDTARRLLAGSAVWVAVDFTGFALWQFLGPGWLFNVVYYFSSFLIPTLLCITAAVAVLVPIRTLSARSTAAVILCAAATLAPLVWIYRSDAAKRIANGYGSDPYLTTFVLMATALLLVAVGCRTRIRAATFIASLAALAGASQAVASSVSTFNLAQSEPTSGDVYNAGQKLIHLLHADGFDRKLPYFWYDVAAPAGVGSLQSLYYYGYTYIGIGMPKIDADFRYRMKLYRPESLVLLCETAGCKGAPGELRRAGYNPHLGNSALVKSGKFKLWVEIYRVRNPAPP